MAELSLGTPPLYDSWMEIVLTPFSWAFPAPVGFRPPKAKA